MSIGPLLGIAAGATFFVSVKLDHRLNFVSCQPSRKPRFFRLHPDKEILAKRTVKLSLQRK